MTYQTAAVQQALASLGMADRSQYFLRLADLPDDAFLVESVRLDGWSFHRDFTIELKVLTCHPVEVDALASQLTLSVEKDVHLAKLESMEGDITLHAGQAMTFDSGQDQTATVGADHSVHVHNNQNLMNQEGKITVEAATDIEYRAGQNLRWQSREGEMTVESADAIAIKGGTIGNN